MKLTHNQNLDAIEKMIDENTLRYVLETLAEVCSTKADHVRENWQDEQLANRWERYAIAAMQCADHFGRPVFNNTLVITTQVTPTE